MEDNGTEPHLLTMITNYLKGRDKMMMELIVCNMHKCLPCYYGQTRLVRLAKMQDRLGWDCMLEGRIPTLFVTHQRAHLAHKTTRMITKRWAHGIITRLLQMTHKQLLLRNPEVHIKQKGDLNAEDHNKLLTKIKS